MNAIIDRRSPAEEKINFRAPKATRALIDEAADALGKKRTAFMLDALSEKAHEVLADRTQFQLSKQQIASFNRSLDQPVSDAALRMLAKPAPWDR